MPKEPEKPPVTLPSADDGVPAVGQGRRTTPDDMPLHALRPGAPADVLKNRIDHDRHDKEHRRATLEDAFKEHRSAAPPAETVDPSDLSPSEILSGKYRQPTPPESEPKPNKHGSGFDAADIIVLVFCELIAIPLCHAGWDAIVMDHHIGRGLVALFVGFPIGIAGGSFHWWKDKTPRFGDWLKLQASRWWIVAVILAFAYVAGPAMYRRATAPVALTGAIGEMPIGTKPYSDPASWNVPPSGLGGPLGPIAAVQLAQTLDALPKPCLIKLTGPHESELRKTIEWIVVYGHANQQPICSIQQDSPIPSADEPPLKLNEQPGIIVHWNEPGVSAEKVAYFFIGMGMKASSSRILPPRSPNNLIWIDIGPGSPWKQ